MHERPPDIDRILLEAVDHHQALRWPEAERLYRIILQSEPRHPDANHNLGVLAVQVGNPRAALPFLKTALAAVPNHTQYVLSYTEALIGAGLSTDALAILEQAVGRGLSGGKVRQLIERAKIDIAIANLMTSGLRHRQSNDLSNSSAAFRQVLCLVPQHFEALHQSGLTAYQGGDLSLALSSMLRAARVNGAIATIHSNLGLTLLTIGEHEMAKARCKTAVALDPAHASAYSNLGSVLLEQNLLEQAQVIYRRSLAIRPSVPETMASLANSLLTQGKLHEAVEQYRAVLAIRPDVPEIVYGFGNAVQKMGQLNEAILLYRWAVVTAPSHCKAYYSLGSTLFMRGRAPEAVCCLTRAITLEPNHPGATIQLGFGQIERGDISAALALANAAAGQLQDEAEDQFSLGLLFAKCGRTYSASLHLLNYLRYHPRDEGGARLILAGMGYETLPDRASESQLQSLYAMRSAIWDEGGSGYRGHEMVANALVSQCADRRSLDIMDAGCGTGLVGALVRPFAARLDGVDLSSYMLNKAREKNIYDTLYCGDLVEILHSRAESYDAIVSAATLIHFGDLRPVFLAAARALRDAGLFIFTVFPSDDDESYHAGPIEGVGAKGCFLHGRTYIARTAADSGFAVISLSVETHEIHRDEAADGLIVVLSRRP